MLFKQRFVPGLAIASYIVGDEKTGDAVVIDPTRDVEDFIGYARVNNLHIRHIIETRVYADFLAGSRELKARLDGKPVIHCSAYGGDDWTQPYADDHVKECNKLELGPISEAYWEKRTFAVQHTACKLRNRFTIEKLSQHFGLGD